MYGSSTLRARTDHVTICGDNCDGLSLACAARRKSLISWWARRTRTCNPTVMSGGISASFVDFAVVSFGFARVRCLLAKSFLVRNWCGHAYACRRAGIDIYRTLSGR